MASLIIDNDMIIYFQSSDSELSSAKTNDLEVLISDLMDAAIKGRHHVIIERDTAKWLFDNINIIGQRKSKLENLIQNNATRSSIIKIAPIYLSVIIGELGLTEVADGKYRIGHTSLAKTELLDKPHFAVENSINDGQLFGEIFKAMKNQHPVRVVEYELEMGGGSSLSEVFDQKLKNQRITVAVADGDKWYPGDNESGMLGKLRWCASQQVFIGTIQSLPCRDAENLLPVEIIFSQRICPQYPHVYYDRLISLQTSGAYAGTDQCPLLYFDMKEGVILSKLSAKTQALQDWVHQSFSDGSATVLSEDFPGFGVNLLSAVLNKPEALQELNRHIREKKWQEFFYQFFANLRWYFAAENPQSTA